MASLGLVSQLTVSCIIIIRRPFFFAVVSSQLHNSYLPTSCCPVFFINSATKKNRFLFGCHPLDGVTRGGLPSGLPPTFRISIIAKYMDRVNNESLLDEWAIYLALWYRINRNELKYTNMECGR